jgi:hypothetical protein
MENVIAIIVIVAVAGLIAYKKSPAFKAKIDSFFTK